MIYTTFLWNSVTTNVIHCLTFVLINLKKINIKKIMKALVYHGPGKKSWEEKPKSVINEPTDAVVKIS